MNVFEVSYSTIALALIKDHMMQIVMTVANVLVRIQVVTINGQALSVMNVHGDMVMLRNHDFVKVISAYQYQTYFNGM